MNLAVLSQIEAHIDQLSLAEQLWLLERLTQRLREQLVVQTPFEQQLTAMAADPTSNRSCGALRRSPRLPLPTACNRCDGDPARRYLLCQPESGARLRAGGTASRRGVVDRRH
jgi:hypothetical protein